MFIKMIHKLLGTYQEEREKSRSIFLSVVGVYVVRTSSLNDKQVANFSEKLPVLFFFLLLSPRLASDHLLQS